MARWYFVELKKQTAKKKKQSWVSVEPLSNNKTFIVDGSYSFETI